MNDHIKALLQGHQYSEELKEQAVLRVLFGGEDTHQVMDSLNIHNNEISVNCFNSISRFLENDRFRVREKR